MLRRLLLAACAATLLVAAPAAHADDASLTATAKEQQKRYRAAERASKQEMKGLEDAGPRKMARVILPVLDDYVTELKGVSAALEAEQGSTPDGRRARGLLLRGLSKELASSGFLRRGMLIMRSIKRSDTDRKKLGKAFGGLGQVIVAQALTIRAERLRERGLHLLGIPYESKLLDQQASGVDPEDIFDL